MSGGVPQPRIRLLVLYGGRSAEHEVSAVSARHVLAAADPARYDLRVVGITTGGQWVDVTAALGSGLPPQALPSPDAVVGADERALHRALEPVEAVTQPGAGPLVVLPLLHGPMGEDGSVQGLLEVAGVPYCGAGVAGSAAAMDKGLAKALLRSAGLPQTRYVFVRETDFSPGLADRVQSELGWPVFVKPANMGSSIGISRVEDREGLGAALDLVRRYDEFVVIEEAVFGRELEIGVLGWPRLRASVPGEIIPSHQFYDYDDKYVDGAASLEVPARVPAGVPEDMGRLAVAACETLRVDCMARVDFFLEEDGRGLLINEVNTIPGFTPISMYPRLWEASGVPYRALVDELVSQALRRSQRRSEFETERP